MDPLAVGAEWVERVNKAAIEGNHQKCPAMSEEREETERVTFYE